MIAKGEVSPPKKRQRKTTKSKSSQVHGIKVRKDVWEEAKKAEDQLPKRYLYIESETSVLVLNHPIEETPWLKGRQNKEGGAVAKQHSPEGNTDLPSGRPRLEVHTGGDAEEEAGS